MSLGESLAKKLIAELRDTGRKDAYLDKARDRLDLWQSQDELKREILKEMAAALGRAERRLAHSLERLRYLGREIDGVPDTEAGGRGPEEMSEEMNGLIDAFNEARRQALQYQWELTIQREALGFRDHRELRTLYPVPASRARVPS